MPPNLVTKVLCLLIPVKRTCIQTQLLEFLAAQPSPKAPAHAIDPHPHSCMPSPSPVRRPTCAWHQTQSPYCMPTASPPPSQPVGAPPRPRPNAPPSLAKTRRSRILSASVTTGCPSCRADIDKRGAFNLRFHILSLCSYFKQAYISLSLCS